MGLTTWGSPCGEMGFSSRLVFVMLPPPVQIFPKIPVPSMPNSSLQLSPSLISSEMELLLSAAKCPNLGTLIFGNRIF